VSKEKEMQFSKKHPADKRPSSKVVQVVKKKAKGGEMACALAFEVAGELGVDPKEVGFALDYLEIPIVKCQLGLFGYKPQKKIIKAPDSVDPSLEEAIRKRSKDGKLSCKEAWAVAESMGLGKLEVASACEALGVKISRCQLGAF